MPLVDPVAISREVPDTVTASVTPNSTSDASNQTGADGTTANAAPADALPDKFKGKSATEIARSYSELETELGRARNEIGTQRRLVDELLSLRREPAPTKSAPARPEVTPAALAERPEETIVAVATQVANERVAQAEQRVAALESQITGEQFARKHTDANSIVVDPNFVTWVRSSPYRLALAAKGHAGSIEAADELLSLWKESRPSRQAGEDPKKGAKDASLARSGGSGANGVVSGSDGKKVWRRDELARMYIDNPEEYARLQPEIQAAYREKRVR